MKKLSNITESVWGGMLSRSIGDAKRQEDAFNPEYVDFGEDTTVYWAVDNLVIDDTSKFYFDEVKDYNNNGWRLPTIEEVKQVDWYNIRKSWYDGCWHIKFTDGNELKLLTNGEGGFHMWTNEPSEKYKSSVWSYGYDNMTKFDITLFNKYYNRLYVFLVKDKTHINESVWGGMLSRSIGDTVRKEDDINLLDIDGFYEYIMKHYEPSYKILIAKNAAGIKDCINIAILKADDIIYRVVIYDFDKNSYITIPAEQPFCDSDLFVKISENFELKEIKCKGGTAIFSVWPKGIIKKTELNKFFLEVIDFIIDNVEEPFELLLKRK